MPGIIPFGRSVAAVLMGLSFLYGHAGAAENAEDQAAFKNVSAGTHAFEVSVDGAKRRYVIHVPRSYNPVRKWPVVVVFHGGGGTARSAMRDGWTESADEESFLAVFPEGTSPHPSRPGRFLDNPQTWNDGSGRFNVGAAKRNVDDVGFVRVLLADLAARFAVDHQRIFVTGFSNGASMSFKIGRELSDRVAAIAPVAGADWAVDPPELGRPISLLYLTGTAEPLNPIGGGAVKIGQKTFGTKPPMRDMIQRWTQALGCQSEPKSRRDEDYVKVVGYGPCEQGSEVVLYTLEGHGHHWPGGRSALPESLAGKNTTKLKATEVIWEFFKWQAKVD